MQIRIEGYDLPGRTCAGSPDFPGYRDVHVAVQRRNRRDELYGVHPGDAPGASWTLDCVATPVTDEATDLVADGAVDITGPYVQGGLGARFVYLSWGTVDTAGAFTLFRRAKLILAAIPPDVATAALSTDLLTARLRLTDAKGHPLCARVVPPWVSWTA